MKRRYYLKVNIVLSYENNPEIGPDEIRTQLLRFVNDGTVRCFEEYGDWYEIGQVVFEIALFSPGPMPEEFRRWLEDICD